MLEDKVHVVNKLPCDIDLPMIYLFNCLIVNQGFIIENARLAKMKLDYLTSCFECCWLWDALSVCSNFVLLSFSFL